MKVGSMRDSLQEYHTMYGVRKERNERYNQSFEEGKSDV